MTRLSLSIQLNQFNVGVKEFDNSTVIYYGDNMVALISETKQNDFTDLGVDTLIELHPLIVKRVLEIIKEYADKNIEKRL